MTGTPEVTLFVGDSQPVEIHHCGLWFSGELLGWTVTAEQRVLARVRCVVDGLRHSTWKDLAELRLPDPAHPPRRESFPAAASSPVGREDDDATRPHALLAGQTARPSKPRYVRTPPPTRRSGVGPAPITRTVLPAHPNRRRSDELSPV